MTMLELRSLFRQSDVLCSRRTVVAPGDDIPRDPGGILSFRGRESSWRNATREMRPVKSPRRQVDSIPRSA